MKRNFPVAFLLGLLATPVPYLGTLLDSASALLYRDLSNVQIPLRAEWIRAVRELGRLPHWDPFHLGGMPFLSDASYGPLYPLNLFFLLFDPADTPRALLYFILAHHILLYLGGYLLARELRLRPCLRALAGILFACSGYATSSDNLLHLLGAQTAMPFLFCAWRRALHSARIGKDLAIASLLLAWPVYAGDPQFSLIAAAACALSAILHPSRNLAPLLGSLILLATLAAAPQLLPMAAHLTGEAARFSAATLENQTAWSLHPLRLLETIFPLAFGETPESGSLAGASLVNPARDSGYPFLFSFYVSAGSFVLLALVSVGRVRRLFRRKKSGACLAAWGCMTLLALGSYSPLPFYALLYRILPLWKGFRYPERLGYWVAMPLAICALLAAERLLRTRPGVRPAWAAALVFTPLALLATGWGYAHGISLRGALQACVVVAGSLLILRLQTRLRGAALSALLALDLISTSARLVWPQALAVLEPANLPPAARLIAQPAPGLGPRRFLSLYETSGLGREALGKASVLALDTAHAWLFLRANTSAYFGIENAIGHSSLPTSPEFLRQTCAEPACVKRVAELLSVRNILRPGTSGPELLELPSALPFAFLPVKLLSATSAGEAFRAALDPSLDPRLTAIVEGASSANAGPSWELLGLERAWDRIRLRLRGAEGGEATLVVNEAFSPGWKARPDLPVLRANGWAIAVTLPKAGKGENLELELRYTESSFHYGLALLLLWLAVSGWLIAGGGAGAANGARQVRE